MHVDWNYTDLDAQISSEIQAFVPDDVFDFHAHVYRVDDLHLSTPGYLTEGPNEAPISVWREHIGRQVGRQRLRNGLFIGMPSHNCDLGMVNDFLVEEVRKSSGSRGLILVSPDMPMDRVEEWLRNPVIVGLKPYHFFSRETPVFESSADGYAPEWIWQMADERGLIITLHLVRHGALLDPGNQSYIREKCLRYPGARLVLAHCARGFHAPNTINGLSSIKELPNTWFDTSAICEAAPIVAVLREFGPQRLLWGSDFPVSEIRGRCVTVGDGFVWLQSDVIDWDKLSPVCNPTLYGLESLRALKDACDQVGLSREDIRDIFCGNALRMLGMIS